MRYGTLFVILLVLVAGCAAPRGSTDSSVLPSPTLVPPTRSVTLPTPTLEPSLPSSTPQFHERRLLGYSQGGRPIVAHRFGWGEAKLVLLGDIHGATEENTYRLMSEIAAYYERNPDWVSPQVTLWVIPTINPDGLAHGTRFNSRGVDLNRNADTSEDPCPENDWSPDTFDSDGPVPGGGGQHPFSEVEARLLRDFAADAQVVISYHSQGGMILAAGCGHNPSRELARLLAQATGYQESQWRAYPVTGSMVDYLAFRGIAAAEVELTNKSDIELERNLEGIEAVMEQIEEITWP
ncbi:MAG: M14 family metallopeptidase [Anaerolineae bacterium]